MKTKSSTKAVTRLPCCAGLRKPSTAKTSRQTHIASTCMPPPTKTERNMGPKKPEGGRKTSPCTSFQPVSSAASSGLVSSL
jgi:hypothetical protein